MSHLLMVQSCHSLWRQHMWEFELQQMTNQSDRAKMLLSQVLLLKRLSHMRKSYGGYGWRRSQFNTAWAIYIYIFPSAVTPNMICLCLLQTPAVTLLSLATLVVIFWKWHSYAWFPSIDSIYKKSHKFSLQFNNWQNNVSERNDVQN